MLGLRLVMGKVVLSLGSGGGDTLPRRTNELSRKINGGTLRNTYIHTWRQPRHSILLMGPWKRGPQDPVPEIILKGIPKII